MFFTSSSTGTPGHRAASTDLQNLSRSQNATVLNPAHSAAMSNPPIPENKLSAFKTYNPPVQGTRRKRRSPDLWRYAA